MKIENFESYTKKTPCIILCGPPGSGKGTQSEFIKRTTGFVHISTGDIIRKSGNKKLMDAASSGSFISDKDSLELINNFLKVNKNSKGFIWDGYPRTVSQAISFDELVKNNNLEIVGCILLKPNKKTLMTRLLDRAKKENRADDDIDKIKKRMDDYKLKTEPAIDKLSSFIPKNKWLIIEGNYTLEETNKKIKQLLDEIN